MKIRVIKGFAAAALMVGSTFPATAQSPISTTAQRVEVDKKIYFSVYCVIATGNLKLVGSAVTSALKIAIPFGISADFLYLSKGQTRCYTHRAWQKSGIAPRLDATAKPKFYLKEFAAGKKTGDRSRLCDSPAVCITNSATPGTVNAATDGFVACFEWDASQTSDQKPRSFLVAIGAVSSAALNENNQVQPSLCSARPQS